MSPSRVLLPVMFTALLALLSGCGFQLRAEAQLSPSLQRVHLAGLDSYSALGRDLGNALRRAGVELVDAQADATVLQFHRQSMSTEVLSVGGNARAKEYAMRYHVEFDVHGADGDVLMERQQVELTRSFIFDARQSLGVAAEQDLLASELEQQMVQVIVRRLEALP